MWQKEMRAEGGGQRQAHGWMDSAQGRESPEGWATTGTGCLAPRVSGSEGRSDPTCQVPRPGRGGRAVGRQVPDAPTRGLARDTVSHGCRTRPAGRSLGGQSLDGPPGQSDTGSRFQPGPSAAGSSPGSASRRREGSAPHTWDGKRLGPGGGTCQTPRAHLLWLQTQLPASELTTWAL